MRKNIRKHKNMKSHESVIFELRRKRICSKKNADQSDSRIKISAENSGFEHADGITRKGKI